MIRKRVPKLLTILATAACIFGFVVIAPAATENLPSISPMPTASAVPVGNGYDITCSQANDNQANCVISGCPRVYEDLAGDSINYTINGGEQNNIPKSCGNSTTVTVNSADAFTLAFQGCRGTGLFDTNSGSCGAWVDYQYTPPKKAAVNCPEGSKSATVVPPAQCEALPKVTCPEGSPTADAVSLDKCAPIPAKDCPAGSVSATATPPAVCAPPENVITMDVSGSPGGNANIAINNSSALPGSCAYNAKKQGLGLGPASVDRTVNVPANGTGTIDDLLFPIGVTYNATVKCTGTWDGKQVTLGNASASIG